MANILSYDKTVGYNVDVSHRYEKGFSEQFTVFCLDTFQEVLTMRIYEGKVGTYAVVWANQVKSVQGTTGSAYKKMYSDKKAIVAALECAGFDFAENFRDVKDRELILEAAKVMGYHNTYLFNGHP